MKGRSKGLHLALAVLALAFSLGGCTQSANYQQHEQVDMVTQPSGQDTDSSLREDMEGGVKRSPAKGANLFRRRPA